jgi:hypothetical protein
MDEEGGGWRVDMVLWDRDREVGRGRKGRWGEGGLSPTAAGLAYLTAGRLTPHCTLPRFCPELLKAQVTCSCP